MTWLVLLLLIPSFSVLPWDASCLDLLQGRVLSGSPSPFNSQASVVTSLLLSTISLVLIKSLARSSTWSIFCVGFSALVWGFSSWLVGKDWCAQSLQVVHTRCGFRLLRFAFGHCNGCSISLWDWCFGEACPGTAWTNSLDAASGDAHDL